MINGQKLTVGDVLNIVACNVNDKWIPKHTEFGHFYQANGKPKIYNSVTSFDIIQSHHLLMWAVECGFEWMEIDNKFQKLTPQNRDEYLLGAKLAHNTSKEVSGAIGTITHDAAEKYLIEWVETGFKPADITKFIEKKVIKDTFTPREVQIIDVSIISTMKAVENYINSRKNIFPIMVELPLGSEEVGVAGTADVFMAVLDNDGFVREIEYWDWKTSNSIRDFYAMQCSVYSKFFTEMTGLPVSRQLLIKLSKHNGIATPYVVHNPEKAYKFFLKSVEFKREWIDSVEVKVRRDYQEIVL